MPFFKKTARRAEDEENWVGASASAKSWESEDPEPLPEPIEASPTQQDLTPSAATTLNQVQEEAISVNESDLTTSVSLNTYFEGEITSSDNVEVFGKVKGSITSGAVVKIYGTVIGNIKCVTLIANGAEVDGDIRCDDSVVIGKATVIKGNIDAISASINGKLTGNLISSESASINESAVVLGEIKTCTIEIQRGAVVSGAITMKQPVIPEPIPAEEAPPALVEEASPYLFVEETSPITMEETDLDAKSVVDADEEAESD